ncbi:sensor domain-containing diguanylate cyclase [Reinekea marinisedimentorum]|uniref:PAS domain S-box-containing protein/diguanylate cyclase (GGDEF)-like protein n=1 Tax=Reinekea marinisedimentorum TaxID=230495 RepID=A0A4V2UJP9_9GAMM|nr:sensor domain-containing diguanylate cyclase [Reinekea marinisedimentorum]TCS40996.1 PAS domain S-box-containing protein/diguanylate cyclase (GGDEF)-like protein [Reinekea marinisedimentorum]
MTIKTDRHRPEDPRAFEEMLLRSEAKFSTLFNASPLGMTVVDAETGRFLNVNKAVLNATGYTEDEFLSFSYWDITPEKYRDQELQQLIDLKEKGRFSPNRKEYICKDGSLFPISISGVALVDTDGKEIVLGLIEDISERLAHEKELERLALYDTLTNLPNRRLITERIGQAIAKSQRDRSIFAIFVLDLDNFKPVNDNLGHYGGDELLKETALRIKSLLRRGTDSVSRHGGDEFLLLLTDIKTQDEARRIAKSICKALAKPFQIEDEVVTVSASIGIAVYPDHGTDQITLFRNADKALSRVKEEHGNGCKVFGSYY